MQRSFSEIYLGPDPDVFKNRPDPQHFFLAHISAKKFYSTWPKIYLGKDPNVFKSRIRSKIIRIRNTGYSRPVAVAKPLINSYLEL
jgi:hypothetical protein